MLYIRLSFLGNNMKVEALPRTLGAIEAHAKNCRDCMLFFFDCFLEEDDPFSRDQTNLGRKRYCILSHVVEGKLWIGLIRRDL